MVSPSRQSILAISTHSDAASARITSSIHRFPLSSSAILSNGTLADNTADVSATVQATYKTGSVCFGATFTKRQVRGQLVVGRVTFVPTEGDYDTFAGTGTVRRLLRGVVRNGATEGCIRLLCTALCDGQVERNEQRT